MPKGVNFTECKYKIKDLYEMQIPEFLTQGLLNKKISGVVSPCNTCAL